MRPLILIAALAAISGCGNKEETVYKSPDGTVTATQDGSGNTTVKSSTPGGETTVTASGENATATTTDEKGNKSTLAMGSNVDLSNLGVKLYPGAATKPGSAVSADTPEGVSTTVTLETTDDTAKILDFYKGEIKSDTSATTPQGGMMSGTNTAGDKVAIVIMKNDKGSDVSITVVKKK